MYRRIRTLTAMGAREFVRTPVLLALLAFLPVYIIGVFVLLVPEKTVPLSIDGTVVTADMGAFAAAFMTPVTVAILAGIVGLFLMQSSQAADDRLRLAGYRARDLVLARFGLLVAGTGLVTGASLAVALTAVTPDLLGWFVLAAVLAGLTYGILGIVVGVVLDRLPGVYVMLFAPMLDILMFQNPLVTDSPAWTTLLPGHYATALLFDATFTESVSGGDLLAALGYAVVLLVVE
jgi:ABC-2 type transport system permease protein